MAGFNDKANWLKALKVFYVDMETYWYVDSPTVAQMKKVTNFEGDKMHTAILTQTGSTSHDFVTAKNNRFKLDPQKFEQDVYEMYSIAAVKNLAMKRAKSKKGAMGELLKTVTDAARNAFSRKIPSTFWNLKGGSIGVIGALSAGNTVITLSDPASIRWFEELMYLQSSDTNGQTGSVHPNRVQVVAVNTGENQVTVDADITATTGAGVGDYLFPEGDFGLQFDGIQAWNPPTEALADDDFLTVVRSKNVTRYSGTRFDADGDTESDVLINAVAKHRRAGGRANRAILGTMRFAEFQKEAKAKAYTVVPIKAGKLDLTFEGYRLPAAGGGVVVYEDPDALDDVTHLTNIDNWEMFSVDPVPHFDTQSGDKLLVTESDDGKEFRLCGYYNFRCKRPIDNCAITWG